MIKITVSQKDTYREVGQSSLNTYNNRISSYLKYPYMVSLRNKHTCYITLTDPFQSFTTMIYNLFLNVMQGSLLK